MSCEHSVRSKFAPAFQVRFRADLDQVDGIPLELLSFHRAKETNVHHAITDQVHRRQFPVSQLLESSIRTRFHEGKILGDTARQRLRESPGSLRAVRQSRVLALWILPRNRNALQFELRHRSQAMPALQFSHYRQQDPLRQARDEPRRLHLAMFQLSMKSNQMLDQLQNRAFASKSTTASQDQRVIRAQVDCKRLHQAFLR